MQNIAPTRTLTRRSRDLLYLAGLLALLALLIGVGGLVLHVINFVVPSNDGFEVYDAFRKILLVVSGLLFLLVLIMIIRALTWQTDNLLAKQTGEHLARHLDERYLFIRNISKRSTGYIDAVLLGPPGVLVFRISDAEGIYFNEGARWLTQKSKGEWGTVRFGRMNLTEEAVVDVKALRKYFAEEGLNDIPVYGVVAFTKESPILQFSVQKPVVPVAYNSTLYYDLSDNYFAKDRLDAKTVERVAQLLF